VHKYFPASPVGDVVELFWHSVHEIGAPRLWHREAILPDGCAHLVINLSADRISLYDGMRSNNLVRFGGSMFCGPRCSPYTFLPEAAAVIGVLFRPGGAFRLLRVPAEEFRNSYVPPELAIGNDGLREQLIAAGTPSARFHLLEKHLLRRLRRNVSLHGAVSYAVGALEREASVSIASVLEKIGLSERRFSRVFSEQVGLTPKVFQRVRRFQKTMNSIGSDEEVDWAATAAANGYYDQAHLINEFRAFSSVTPAEFLASRTAQPNHLPLRE
jgi:AraC-like DNA-binding protein